MTPNKKVWLTFVVFVLVFVTIACSCGSITSGIGNNNSQEAISGLAGKWKDPETSDVHTIVWQNNGYVVASTLASDGTNYPVTAQNWSNNVLTWTYSVPGGNMVTFVVVSVSGSNLNTTWSTSAGGSGTETLTRVP
jgi:hypothetical protein